MKHLTSNMLPDLLPSRMCPIRLDIEIEHEAALRATDIDIERRTPAEILLLKQRILDAQNAWIKHCRVCENCNPLLRL